MDNLDIAIGQIRGLAGALKDRRNISAAQKDNLLSVFTNITTLLDEEAQPKTRMERWFGWLMHSYRQSTILDAIEHLDEMRHEFSYVPPRRFLTLDEVDQYFFGVIDGCLDTVKELEQLRTEPAFETTRFPNVVNAPDQSGPAESHSNS